MNTVEAEREVERLLDHADFERRNGSGEHAETPLREALRDALVDKARLGDRVEELGRELEESKSEERFEERRADDLQEAFDKAESEHADARADWAVERADLHDQRAKLLEELADNLERRASDAAKWDEDRRGFEAHVADLEGRLAFAESKIEQVSAGVAAMRVDLEASLARHAEPPKPKRTRKPKAAPTIPPPCPLNLIGGCSVHADCDIGPDGWCDVARPK